MLTGEDPRPAVDSGGVLCANCEVKILPTRSYPPLPLNVLRANQIPSKTEVSQTLDTLQEEKKELHSYDEGIKRLLLTVKRLKGDRKQLYQKMRRRQSWFAPIRRLPAEIMGKIFDEVIAPSYYSLSIREKGHSSDDDEVPTHVRITTLALTLSHVSFHWRSLAFSQKSIWSRISVGLVERMNVDLSPLLQLYLSNAAGHPLRIEIKDETQMFYGSQHSAEKVRSHLGSGGRVLLQILIKHFPSCEELVIDFLQPEVLLHTMEAETSFPLLRTLACDGNKPIFSAHETGVIPSNFLFWNAVRDAPLLQSVRLNETGQSCHQDYIPWRQLTSLSADNINSYADFRFVISRTGQLEVLRVGQGYRLLQHSTTTPRSLDEVQPICLPHLWKVDLFDSIPKAAHYALASLTAPSLRDLRICIDRTRRSNDSSQPECWDLNLFYSMINRSSCHLTRLKLSVLPFSIWGESFTLLVKVLDSSALLEYLELWTGKPKEPEARFESTVGDGTRTFLSSIFSLLAVSSSSSRVLLPRLKDIHVYEHVSTSAQTILSVLDMVGERTTAGLAATFNRRTDISPLANVVIGVSVASDCWSGKPYYFDLAAVKPLAAIEERIVILAGDGIKCSISAQFKG